MHIEKGLHSTEHLAGSAEKQAFEIFTNSIFTLAKEAIEIDHGFQPMVFLFLNDEEIGKIAILPIPAGMFMESNDQKELLASFLHDSHKDLPVVGIGMITEAWRVVKKNDDQPINIRPSEHPDKEEIFISYFESENISKMTQSKILRPDENTLKLSPLEDDDSGNESFAGRFTGFLKDLKKVKEN